MAWLLVVYKVTCSSWWPCRDYGWWCYLFCFPGSAATCGMLSLWSIIFFHKSLWSGNLENLILLLLYLFSQVHYLQSVCALVHCKFSYLWQWSCLIHKSLHLSMECMFMQILDIVVVVELLSLWSHGCFFAMLILFLFGLSFSCVYYQNILCSIGVFPYYFACLIRDDKSRDLVDFDD